MPTNQKIRVLGGELDLLDASSAGQPSQEPFGVDTGGRISRLPGRRLGAWDQLQCMHVVAHLTTGSRRRPRRHPPWTPAFCTVCTAP